MKFYIENMQDRFPYDEAMKKLIEGAAENSLKVAAFDRPCEISIMLTGNEAIREINREYRNIDRATDVLSFPVADMKDGQIISEVGDYDLDEDVLLLGDIVISLERADEQREQYGHSFERELAFLVTHGIFHLLGFDHETPEDEANMMNKQEQALIEMGLTRS